MTIKTDTCKNSIL